MTESSTPTFRPEIAKRPAVDLPKAVVQATASAMPSSGAAASKSEHPDPKVLLIGREISLSGQITACDKVIVEGKVEAQLTDSRFVEVSESGQFKGSAEVEEAEIRGRFEGRLSVRGRLLIRGSGKVSGEIAYGQIEIECGGEISGTVQTVAAGSNRSSSSAAAE
ncbi:MAG TPA: polymer-forming cytoskeletal protein [Ferrovibrio sp.]|uniref:bactofilin family protein n=1 Tax=Ferrovibrio sp. TaxID=1917215 RepID=UPI002ED40C4C